MTAVSPAAIVTYLTLAAAVYVYYALCVRELARRKKLGRAWFAWVPVLNLYLTCRLVDKGVLWTVLFFVPVVNVIMYILICLKLAKVNGRRKLYGVGLMLPILDLFLLWELAFGRLPEPEASAA